MVRKLKTYQASLGFFDMAIAAPSMKAALEAWGADSNLFHQGVAKEATTGRQFQEMLTSVTPPAGSLVLPTSLLLPAGGVPRRSNRPMPSTS